MHLSAASASIALALCLAAAAPAFADVAPPATTTSLPLGFELRSMKFEFSSMARMEEHPINRDIYAIGLFTPLLRVDVHGGALTAVPVANVRALGLTFNAFASGIDFDADGNVYISSHNGQLIKGHYDSGIETFTTWSQVADLEPVVEVIGAHGFGGLAIDRQAGWLYLNSGSIESGSDPNVNEPEHGINARILRMRLDGSGREVYAEGNRNHFALTVRSDGAVFGLDNASECEYADEFNMITQGSHLGFPYRAASDRSGSDTGLFPDCDKPAPDGLTFTPAWGNLGPDGIPQPGQPGHMDGGIYYGFHAHSTPTGIDFYEPAEMDSGAILFPPEYRGRAFMTRLGASAPGVPPFGFDLLTLELHEAEREFVTNALLTDLSHPIDVVCAKNGKVYVLLFDEIPAEGTTTGPGGLLELAYTIPGNAPASYLAKRQTLQIQVPDLGAQLLTYRYATGSAWISPYQAATGGIPYLPVTGEFIGLFHYDYATARFSQVVHPKHEWLP